MIRKFSILLAGAAVGLTAAACETAATDEPDGVASFADDPRLGERADRICFTSQIDGFGQATDRTIVVEAGVNEHYLIETFGYCPNLDWAQSIRFDAFSSCLTRGDSLMPYETLFASDYSGLAAPRACLISSIHEWNPDAGG